MVAEQTPHKMTELERREKKTWSAGPMRKWGRLLKLALESKRAKGTELERKKAA
jgi:hypothetical protein